MNHSTSTNISDKNDSIIFVKDIVTIIAMVATVAGYFLAHSYLNNVSLSKECLLLHLYKEVVGVVLWSRAFWMLEVFQIDWYGLRKLQAVIVSFGVWWGAIYLAIILNIIGCLKFYMMRSGTIDPQIPWMGENESTTIKRIRISCRSMVLAFLSICYGLGIYPDTYYAVLYVPMTQSDRTTMYLVLRCPLILLNLIFIVTMVGAKLQKKTMEPNIDKVARYAIILIVIFSLFSVGMVCIAEYLELIRRMNIYLFYLIFISMLHIVVPPIFIMALEQVKSHTLRVLKNLFDEAFFLSIYLVPLFLVFVVYGSLSVLYHILHV